MSEKAGEILVELLGAPLLSGFFNVFFDRIASKEVVEFLRGKKILSDLLFELRAQLCSANKLLADAEEKQLRDPDVKKWIDELRDVVFEADHVLDRINTEALRRTSLDETGDFYGRFRSFLPNLVSFFENSVRFEVKEIIRKLKLLLNQTSNLGLRDHGHYVDNRARVSSFERSMLCPLIEESDVFGRKVEKEAIVKLLLSNSEEVKIGVVPIVGMGGIGKTTLARLVYNDGVLQEHFDLKAWVIVSDNFDIPRIVKTIFEMVVEGSIGSDDPNKIQSDLKSFLRGKKFLFVLDDVWCENYDQWDILRSCFESCERGSKIIVTTRSTVVAKNMGTVKGYDLRTISDEDSLVLFEKHVGMGNLGGDLRLIGTDIVHKCRGLPLAVKSIAGLLRSTSNAEEWRRVLQSDVWELQNTNILPALWLSYQFLPPNLKRCFAFFSMFPTDYEFDPGERDKVVLLWMAEGILQVEKGKRMEDVGRDYFNALISRSFFQRSSRSATTFLMHDLLHDLAIRISGESTKIDEKTRHFLYSKNAKTQSPEEYGGLLSKAKCLRSFLGVPLSKGSSSSSSSSISIGSSLLNQLLRSSHLKVLSLSSSSLTKIPDSFDHVKYLRYLDLSYTTLEYLPDSLCLLYNLQTLLLSHCQKLTHLPSNTCNLTNLRHLDVQNTPLKEMPPRMDGLKNLQELSDFVVGHENDGGGRMKELRELEFLHGSLRISGLENVVEIRDATQANLMEKKFLNKLILSWEGATEDSRKERELLGELRPHPSLKEIEIEGFRGTSFPKWVGNQSSRDLVKVVLRKCNNCVMMPSFGLLPSFKELRIQEMEELERIDDDFCGDSSSPFPALEILSLDGLLRWKEWSFSHPEFESGRFPCLKHLHLEFCKKLDVGLPVGRFPSLKTVSIVSCRSMEAVFSAGGVSIDASFPSLESIQIWRCPKLESFSKEGLPCNLRKLEIHDGCEVLFVNRSEWGLQRLTYLERLELSGCRQAVDSFPEDELLPPNLARLRINSFRNLKCLNGSGFRGLTSLQQLSISGCEQLEGLPEEGLPRSLSYLRIVQCRSLNQRCQRNTGKDWPKIQHIPLIIINREAI